MDLRRYLDLALIFIVTFSTFPVTFGLFPVNAKFNNTFIPIKSNSTLIKNGDWKIMNSSSSVPNETFLMSSTDSPWIPSPPSETLIDVHYSTIDQESLGAQVPEDLWSKGMTKDEGDFYDSVSYSNRPSWTHQGMGEFFSNYLMARRKRPWLKLKPLTFPRNWRPTQKMSWLSKLKGWKPRRHSPRTDYPQRFTSSDFPLSSSGSTMSIEMVKFCFKNVESCKWSERENKLILLDDQRSSSVQQLEEETPIELMKFCLRNSGHCHWSERDKRWYLMDITHALPES